MGHFPKDVTWSGQTVAGGSSHLRRDVARVAPSATFEQVFERGTSRTPRTDTRQPVLGGSSTSGVSHHRGLNTDMSNGGI